MKKTSLFATIVIAAMIAGCGDKKSKANDKPKDTPPPVATEAEVELETKELPKELRASGQGEPATPEKIEAAQKFLRSFGKLIHQFTDPAVIKKHGHFAEKWVKLGNELEAVCSLSGEDSPRWPDLGALQVNVARVDKAELRSAGQGCPADLRKAIAFQYLFSKIDKKKGIRKATIESKVSKQAVYNSAEHQALVGFKSEKLDFVGKSTDVWVNGKRHKHSIAKIQNQIETLGEFGAIEVVSELQILENKGHVTAIQSIAKTATGEFRFSIEWRSQGNFDIYVDGTHLTADQTRGLHLNWFIEYYANMFR